jgi:transient receptor potential cation channel subfamily M protein 2
MPAIDFQIQEIIIFMVLLVVFIVGYGVASQALIDPYRQFDSAQIWPFIANNILFLPYWQMFGELSLDE